MLVGPGAGAVVEERFDGGSGGLAVVGQVVAAQDRHRGPALLGPARQSSREEAGDAVGVAVGLLGDGEGDDVGVLGGDEADRALGLGGEVERVDDGADHAHRGAVGPERGDRVEPVLGGEGVDDLAGARRGDRDAPVGVVGVDGLVGAVEGAGADVEHAGAGGARARNADGSGHARERSAVQAFHAGPFGKEYSAIDSSLSVTE